MNKRRRLSKNAYSPVEVAEYLKCAHTTIHRLIYKGKLNAFRLPGSRNWKIPKESLFEFLESIGAPIPDGIQPAAVVDQPPPQRNKDADREWKRLICNPQESELRVAKMLDANLQALSVLTPLQRIGYVQAAADVVADFERLERERASA